MVGMKLTILLASATLGLVSAANLPVVHAPAPAPATQDDQSAEVRRYVMKGGKSVRGSVLALDGDRVRLKVMVAGGSGEAWYDLSAFEDKSQVDLRRAGLASDDYQGMLDLSAFALDKGLVDAARKELRFMAHSAQVAGTPLSPELQAGALDLTNKIILALCEAGKVGDARTGVRSLLTKRGSDMTEAQRQQLMDTLDKGIAARKAATAAKKEARKDAKLAAETERKLAPLRKAVKDGEAYRRKGLLESKNQAKSRRDLKKAVAEFDRARKGVAKMADAGRKDEALGKELIGLSQEATTGWHDCLLSLASQSLSTGQFNDANASVNTVLADFPKDKEALAMRARIESASNDWGWWR